LGPLLTLRAHGNLIYRKTINRQRFFRDREGR
jgi:hypothetical protein